MSRNYIKVLLEPFRESKVVGSLLKWFELSGSASVGADRSGENEVGSYFLEFVMMCLRLGDRSFLVISRCQ